MSTVVKKDEQVINFTNIKFDKELIKFIGQIRDEVPSHSLTTRGFNTLQDEQEVIRQKMMKYQYMLNFNSENIKLTESNTCHPDFYALMLAFISDLSKCYSWDNIIEQSKDKDKVTLADFEHEIEDDIGALDGYKCACNHHCFPMNQYLLSNKFTNHNLLIGCDCIEKNKILNKEDIKALKEKRNFDKNYKKLMKLNEDKLLNKRERKKYLQIMVIDKLNEIIQNRNRKFKKVFNFMRRVLMDKVDFQKYKYMNISWYKFTHLSKKNFEIKRYIDYVLNAELTSEKRKTKLKFYLHF